MAKKIRRRESNVFIKNEGSKSKKKEERRVRWGKWQRKEDIIKKNVESVDRWSCH